MSAVIRQCASLYLDNTWIGEQTFQGPNTYFGTESALYSEKLKIKSWQEIAAGYANSWSLGYANQVGSIQNDQIVVGNANTIDSFVGSIFGTGNNISGGEDCNVFGQNNTSGGATQQVFGFNNNAGSGTNNIAVGAGNFLGSHGDQFALGFSNTVSTAATSMAFGRNLNNLLANSLDLGISDASKLSLLTTYGHFRQKVGIGTIPAAQLHVLATTEQLRLGYDASNYVSGTVSSGGNLSLQTTAGATAGVYTLTPHGAGGDGTNRTLSFGRAWGNAALWLYNNGANTRFGWGMRADTMQFFAPTTTGGLFTWNRGGDLQATGTNEILRLQQYAAGTGAGLGMGSVGYAPVTPYRIDFQGVSATTGTAGTEGILRFSRIQTGGVSYPEAFTIGLGRYSSSGTGPDTRVDFHLKSTAATNYTADALVMSLQSNLKIICYGEVEIDGDLNHDGTNVGLYNVAPVARATVAGAAAAFVANTSGIVNDTATFDGYTIGQVVKALRNIGILT